MNNFNRKKQQLLGDRKTLYICKTEKNEAGQDGIYIPSRLKTEKECSRNEEHSFSV